YSHPAIRLKKLAWTSWLITGIFQGLFTFGMAYVGVNDLKAGSVGDIRVVIPGLLTSAMLWANYPLTQVYQHEEDLKRGDVTLSAKLGVTGTFYFAATAFAVALAGFLLYLKLTFGNVYAWGFLLTLMPMLSFFFYWFFRVVKDVRAADYDHTMRMNLISGIWLN